MQKGHVLSFECHSCQKRVRFSVIDLQGQDGVVNCPHCDVSYAFWDETLKRQLQKFEALCRQVAESEEILSNASVGIDLRGEQVKIPYRILLTRMTSLLDLKMGDRQVQIEFRMEPRVDLVQ